MTTTAVAHRAVRKPRSVVTVLLSEPDRAAAMILRQIRRIRSDEGTGAYLFIDPMLRCYVMGEEHSAVKSWLTERWADFVAFYQQRHMTDEQAKIRRLDRKDSQWMFPTMDGIMEDIAGHIDTVAR